MTNLWGMIPAVAPAIAAPLVLRAPDERAARRIAAIATLAGFAFALLSGLVGGRPLLSAFVMLIGLVSVAMSPVRQGSAATLTRSLVVTALTTLLLETSAPAAIGVLWVAVMVPPWLELRSWEATRTTARIFAVYMAPSAVLVGVGCVLLHQGATSAAVIPLAVGFAFREAIVPLHSWFPIFFERAPMSTVVTFVAPQVGVHAHLATLSEGMPPSVATTASVLGAITAVYAAMMGVVQTRTRRAAGYLVMSQSGLLAFGLDVGAGAARTGTLVAWWVIGLSVAGFAMSIAALEARRGALRLDRPHGTFRHVPRLAAAFLVLGLSSVGLPGTLGFVAEDLLVQGSIDASPALALVLVFATALNGITVVRNFFVLFTGASEHTGERDLTGREASALTAVLVFLVGAGVAPSLIVHRAGWITSHMAHASGQAVERHGTGHATPSHAAEHAISGSVASP